MLHCDKSPDKLPQRPLRRRSPTPDRHGSDLASLAVVALVGMGAGISAYPIRASLLKRNCRPGLAIIITLEAAQLPEAQMVSIAAKSCSVRSALAQLPHMRRRASAGTSRTARQAGSNEPTMQSTKAATRIGAITATAA
jgi:hypothetical protein